LHVTQLLFLHTGNGQPCSRRETQSWLRSLLLSSPALSLLSLQLTSRLSRYCRSDCFSIIDDRCSLHLPAASICVCPFCCMTISVIQVHECVAHAMTCCEHAKACCARMAVLLTLCCWSCWVQVSVTSTEPSRTLIATTPHCVMYMFASQARSWQTCRST